VIIAVGLFLDLDNGEHYFRVNDAFFNIILSVRHRKK